MAVRIKEKPRQSAEVDVRKPSTVREYTCMGSSDRLEVLIALGNETPRVDQCTDTSGALIDLFRSKINLIECGGGVWEAVNRYEGASQLLQISFSIGTQSVKIYQAIDTVQKFNCITGGTLVGDADDNEVPALNDVIGVNGDDVEGVTIEVGKVDLTVTKTHDQGLLPANYLSNLMEYTSRTAVNDALWTLVWRGQILIFPDGTLRFRGASVKEESFASLTIDYQFTYERDILTADNFRIGSSDIITKQGQNYGWVMYKTTVDRGITTKTPVVYVENKVYPRKDFGLFEL